MNGIGELGTTIANLCSTMKSARTMEEIVVWINPTAITVVLMILTTAIVCALPQDCHTVPVYIFNLFCFYRLFKGTSGLVIFVGCQRNSYNDGYCDSANNNAECGYDGGDCPSSSCSSMTTPLSHNKWLERLDGSLIWYSSETAENYQDAVDLCSNLNPTSWVFEPRNEDLFTRVLEDTIELGFKGFWLGLTDVAVEGT